MVTANANLSTHRAVFAYSPFEMHEATTTRLCVEAIGSKKYLAQLMKSYAYFFEEYKNKLHASIHEEVSFEMFAKEQLKVLPVT